MNRQEQVRLNAPGLLNPHLQRHEEIGVARQHGAHIRLGINSRLEALGHRQSDILFVGTALTNRAGILTTMARIERDRDHPVNNRPTGFLGGMNLRGLRHLLDALRLLLGKLLGPPEVLIHFQWFNRIFSALDKRHQGIRRVERVDIEDQTMAIFANRFDLEHLRSHLGLELHDQTHHARLEAASAE